MTNEEAQDLLDELEMSKEDQKLFFKLKKKAETTKVKISKADLAHAVANAWTSTGLIAVKTTTYVLFMKRVMDAVFGKEKEDETV